MFVGWFISRIAQKILIGFPQMEDESQPRIDLVSCADKGIRNVSLTFFSCKKQDTFQRKKKRGVFSWLVSMSDYNLMQIPDLVSLK